LSVVHGWGAQAAVDLARRHDRRRFAADIRSVFSLTLAHASSADVRNARRVSEPRLGTLGPTARGVGADAQGLGRTDHPWLGDRDA
jgi:hypothetical protein